ncbi:MAG: arginine repressor [Bdellovibrionaceae bacterium]|nr:arginine repressor [Pseudobdellovibrionaceae bacterium]
MAIKETRHRLKILKQLLGSGELSTQDELVYELKKRDFEITQSTISRDLRKLGAIKAIDPMGRTIYKLSEETKEVLPVTQQGFQGLIIKISHNGSLIVIHTSPGSASLVARQLDILKKDLILGTIAGDDTVFVAPVNVKKIEAVMKSIIKEFNLSR